MKRYMPQSAQQLEYRAGAVLRRDREAFTAFSAVTNGLDMRRQLLKVHECDKVSPTFTTIYRPLTMATNKIKGTPSVAVVLAKHEIIPRHQLLEAQYIGYTEYFETPDTERIVRPGLVLLKSIVDRQTVADFRRPQMEVVGDGSVAPVIHDPSYILSPTDQLPQQRWLEELEHRQADYLGWLVMVVNQQMA